MTACLAGCYPKVDPFTDELAGQSPVTTPSVEGVHAAGPAKASMPEAGYDEPIMVHMENGAVTHSPLYFDDPYNVPEAADNVFAWTMKDYWCFFYSGGRFMANTVLLPVSFVTTPPWTIMESDGSVCHGSASSAK